MKRLFACLLVLMLAVSGAIAEAAVEVGAAVEKPDSLTLTVDATYVTDEWNGETSETHAWIVVEVTLTNYELEILFPDEVLSASLVYDGKYEFEADIVFSPMEVEPLVRLPGTIVFRVPKLVSEADPAELVCTLAIGGEEHSLLLDYRRSFTPGIADIYFDAPEDAIEYFADRVQNVDFEGALAAFDSEVKAQNYDYIGYITRIRSVYPSMEMPFPSDFSEYIPLNRMNAQSYVSNQTHGFIASILIDPNFLINTGTLIIREGMLSFSDEEIAVEDLVARYNPERLEALELVELYLYDSEESRSETYLENIERRGAIYGYVQLLDYIGVYTFEEQLYVHSYTVVQYPEGWKINSMNSNLLGTDPWGNATPIVPEELEELAADPDYVRVK